MKNTINGFRQDKILENKLDLADSLILRLLSDMYSSNSNKIDYLILEYEVEDKEKKTKKIEKDKFMWITYDYLYSQIPIVGSKNTFIRKITELIKKGFLKKQVVNSKKGKKGTFLFVSFGEKFSELIEYEDEENRGDQNDKGGYPKEVGGLPKMSRGGTQNDKGGYPKWVTKDSSITDSSVRDKEKEKKKNTHTETVYLFDDEKYKEKIDYFFMQREDDKGELGFYEKDLHQEKLYQLSNGNLQKALEILDIAIMRKWKQFFKLKEGEENTGDNYVQKTQEQLREEYGF